MAFQHFIWDFDGTLFDSYPHIAGAFQRALREYGLAVSTDEIMPWLKQSVAKAADHFRRQYGLDDRLIELYCGYEDRADEGAPVVPYAGIEKLCHDIQARGGFNYLYSHRGESALYYMARFGLSASFRDFITSENHFAEKPAPDAIRYLIRKFSMNPDTAVMIGDRDIDVLAGTNAGIHGCFFDPDGCFPGFQAEYTAGSVRVLRQALLPAAPVASS